MIPAHFLFQLVLCQGLYAANLSTAAGAPIAPAEFKEGRRRLATCTWITFAFAAATSTVLAARAAWGRKADLFTRAPVADANKLFGLAYQLANFPAGRTG